jgi:hypothetical protein
MSGHTWTHQHQDQPVVRNLGQEFRQPPPPPTPPTWTAPATTRSPLGHPRAGAVHVGPHAHHDIRPGHPHAAPNLFGRVPRPGHPRAPHFHWQESSVYRDGRHQGLGYHDPRTVYTPGQMNGFCVTPEVIPASPHDDMIQENKINQAMALVNKDKVPMPYGPNLLTVASNRKAELQQIVEQCQLNPNMYPLIPGHILPIAERLSGHTFISPFDMDGYLNSLKHLRKFIRDELESSLAAERMTGKIELSSLGLTGVSIDVYDRQLKQLLRILFRGSLQTVLSESLLQVLFIVVHTNGGSTAMAAQLMRIPLASKLSSCLTSLASCQSSFTNMDNPYRRTRYIT